MCFDGGEGEGLFFVPLIMDYDQIRSSDVIDSSISIYPTPGALQHCAGVEKQTPGGSDQFGTEVRYQLLLIGFQIGPS